MHKALIMSATALMLNAMAPTATLAEETDIIDARTSKAPQASSTSMPLKLSDAYQNLAYRPTANVYSSA